MTLIERSSYPGDKIGWRNPDDSARVVLRGFSLAAAGPAIDETERELGAHRAEGVRKALDHLRAGQDNGRSANYRQARAIIAMAISVQRQALVAGLGHVHVGTTACGPMCEPLDGAL